MIDFVPTPEQEEQVKKARDILMRSAGRREFAELILEKMQPGFAVHAGRGMGKTEALITAVHEREDGNAMIVVPNSEMGALLLQRYRNAFLSHTGGREPQIVNATRTIKGQHICSPIYCDEWWMMPESSRYIIAKSGLVVYAVGTMPGLAGTIDAFPLTERRWGNGQIEVYDDGTFGSW